MHSIRPLNDTVSYGLLEISSIVERVWIPGESILNDTKKVLSCTPLEMNPNDGLATMSDNFTLLNAQRFFLACKCSSLYQADYTKLVLWLCAPELLSWQLPRSRMKTM
jgi:hypothetical protein